ncbi:hypothetical protein [Haladaptatus halobius]|uniref:hypothetical protein n=1 Tax=Haladaptatus halobius TaxID=2884875 RepID=UPI001D0B2E3C|nr:hypothetical protein [Haladaptatus halobius]
MIGTLTVLKKAVKFGYRRYGIPGAIVAGVVGGIGFIWGRKKLKTIVNSELNEQTNEETDKKNDKEKDNEE